MGTRSQGTGAELAVGEGAQLVGMKQGDLKGCRGVIPEVVEGKAQVVLVWGVRRVRVDDQKGEEMWRWSRWKAYHQILWMMVFCLRAYWIRPGAAKENIKAHTRDGRLHPDQNKNNQAKVTKLSTET